MSVLFYRRPDYLAKPNGPITSTECMRYIERAKNSERAIPKGLSFEDVINQRSLPPCTLGDFMDYLVYIEHNAENLQFYLWYQDYAKRWNEQVPEKERLLSPEWKIEEKEIPKLAKDESKQQPENHRRKGSRSSKIIIQLLTAGYGKNEKSFMFEGDEQAINRPDTASFVTASDTTTNKDVSEAAGMKWQPFSVQPCRDEVNRVIHHYLAVDAPRELNLSHKDRATTLHALQHTTHPSAFAPVLKVVELALRGQSHPNFIRWSICNGNQPRVFFVRTMGVLSVALGFVIAILITLSHVSRWWRIMTAIIWFIGFGTLIAAYKGLCLIMYRGNTRNLRPWEIDDDESRSSYDSSTSPELQLAEKTSNGTVNYRPGSMQSFGSRNDEEAAWMANYQKKPLIRKIFEKETWTQDPTLRILQDKIVIGSQFWSAITTIILTTIFVALPKGNFF